jgi:cAMP-binding proteins - catabolite gene activator and regulatory subunit of cAMP-dependent protein kinases
VTKPLFLSAKAAFSSNSRPPTQIIGGVTIQPVIPFDAIPPPAALKREDRAAVEPLCRMRGYDKGDTIFLEGEPADRIHFLYTGRVKIVKAAGSRDIILEILGPGEPIGAVAAFERRAYPAAAIAIEPSGVLSIPEREFFQLIERRPEMTRSLLGGLTLRLMMLNKRLADMTGSAESKAARLLLTLAERLGERQGKGALISMPLSRQELADLLGITLETTIRLMSRWQKEDLVRTEKGGFHIPDLEALRNLTHG